MAYSGFWETMNIIIGKDWKKSGREVMDDVQDWVDKVVEQKELLMVDLMDIDQQSGISGKRRFSDGYEFDPVEGAKEVKKFIKRLNLPKIECKFGQPQIRAKLEKLMGTYIVNFTDRNYMQQLQTRIMEHHAMTIEKEMKHRAHKELERVKDLVLSGIIPLSEAPPEMANHPVMLIEQYCSKIIVARRKKLFRNKAKIPTLLYCDDTPDPPSGLSIEQGHIFRPPGEKLCHPNTTHLVASEEEEIQNGYMFTQENYSYEKHEAPEVREFLDTETVEEMYRLAELIVGELKYVVTEPVVVETKSMG